jgi:NhaP-type Na+/H+ or K+/H+ antiporter
LIGFSFGGLLYLLGDITKIDFDEELFFYALLPPMIFAGGYNLKKKDFGKNFKYILIYGLLGTIVSFGVIFGLTYAVNQLQWIVPLRTENHLESLETSLMVKYSATISATDSVAALTLIKSSEFPKIFSIIFGEGMVNDAVAIILFKVVGRHWLIKAASSTRSRRKV